MPGGARGGSGPRRLEAGVAAAIFALPLLALALRCQLDPAIPFVVQDAEAPWIAAPREVSAKLMQWGEVEAPVTLFARRFDVPDPPPERLRLRVRALGELRVRQDGRELLHREASEARREQQVELAAAPGPHELVVEVRNRRGPALLSLRLDGLAEPLVTDESWSVRQDGRVFARAALADDTLRDPRSLALETPAEALVAKRTPLVALLLAGGLLGAWLGAAPRKALLRAAPALALAAAAVGWLVFFVTRVARIPAAVGFDARHHLVYVGQLLEKGALPLASDGWSSYHPPLFYALSAAVAAAGGGELALKVLPWLSGLGIVAVTALLARRLFPGHALLAAVAVGFAAVLPVNLYSAAYFSNEPLHALLASAALLAGAIWLRAEGLAPGRLAAATGLFAAAALTKFTVLVTVPVFFAFGLWKLLAIERAGPARSGAALLASAAGFAALAGWFYLRSYLNHGALLVGNWSLPGPDQTWWQQPGFHTPAYFLGFGEALVHPVYSGFHSLWDGIYSTFWGDAYVAGRADPTLRHDFWDHGWVAATAWLALPATLLLLGGLLRLLREALGAGPPRRRLALGFLLAAGWAVGVAFVSLTLSLPFFTQAKAAYFLMLAPLLGVAFGAGVESADGWLARRGPPARAALWAWLAAFAGACWLGHAG